MDGKEVGPSHQLAASSNHKLVVKQLVAEGGIRNSSRRIGRAAALPPTPLQTRQERSMRALVSASVVTFAVRSAKRLIEARCVQEPAIRARSGCPRRPRHFVT